MGRKEERIDAHIVSVIIPTLGRSTIKNTKVALNRQTRPPDEVLVVQDEKRQGVGWARNEGIKKAKGDLIVFTDDDCIPENDWLERMVSAIDEYQADVVSGNLSETDPFLHEIRLRRNFPQTVRINPTGYVGVGGNVIFRRECFEECLRLDGYTYNPAFETYGSEDLEISWRMRLRGHRIIYIVNDVKHFKKMTSLGYLRQQLIRGIGLSIMYKVQKTREGVQQPDRGLLWNAYALRHPFLKWVVIFWRKLFGPFDYKSFSNYKRFFIFWIGEKVQSFGFLYGFLFKKKAR